MRSLESKTWPRRGARSSDPMESNSEYENMHRICNSREQDSSVRYWSASSSERDKLRGRLEPLRRLCLYFQDCALENSAALPGVGDTTRH